MPAAFDIPVGRHVPLDSAHSYDFELSANTPTQRHTPTHAAGMTHATVQDNSTLNQHQLTNGQSSYIPSGQANRSKGSHQLHQSEEQEKLIAAGSQRSDAQLTSSRSSRGVHGDSSSGGQMLGQAGSAYRTHPPRTLHQDIL